MASNTIARTCTGISLLAFLAGLAAVRWCPCPWSVLTCAVVAVLVYVAGLSQGYWRDEL